MTPTTDSNSDDHLGSNPDQYADPDADHMLPDTHTINYQELERDCAGWVYIGQLGGTIANWVDDPDEPLWGLTVLVTGKAVARDGEGEPESTTDIYGVSRRVASRRASGYTIDHGPSKGDTTTTETVTKEYGTADQTAREVEESIYESVLEKAREWLRNHEPQAMRERALNNGYGPEPLPAAETATDDQQNGLDSFM